MKHIKYAAPRRSSVDQPFVINYEPKDGVMTQEDGFMTLDESVKNHKALKKETYYVCHRKRFQGNL